MPRTLGRQYDQLESRGSHSIAWRCCKWGWGRGRRIEEGTKAEDSSPVSVQKAESRQSTGVE